MGCSPSKPADKSLSPKAVDAAEPETLHRRHHTSIDQVSDPASRISRDSFLAGPSQHIHTPRCHSEDALIDSPKRELRRTDSGVLIFALEFPELRLSSANQDGFEAEPQTREFTRKQFGTTTQKKIERKMSRIKQGTLYQDKEFRPEQKSIWFSRDKYDASVKWKSPSELVEKPMLLVAGVSKDDIAQGELGDCWFLSSCAVIAQDPKLMEQVIPYQAELFGNSYKGLVQFRFWQFGEWVEVIVDDLLPTRDDKLIFARCKDPHEFWLPLLEKAYAKLVGSYEALEGGQTMDAMVDLTGGMAERFEMSKVRNEKLHQLITKAIRARNCFVCCSKEGTYSGRAQRGKSMGLIAGHAYSVTYAIRLNVRGRTENLFRIRNPWGTGEEWSGAWRDNDPMWKQVDAKTLEKLSYDEDQDGEFWMNESDFKENFAEVTICTLKPDLDMDGNADDGMFACETHGAWKGWINLLTDGNERDMFKGQTAGGCRNDPRGYAKNPQFLIKVSCPDDPHDHNKNPDTCNVIIGLMQEHRRAQRHMGMKMLQIAFLIYKVEHEQSSRLSEEFLMRQAEAHRSGTYVNFREVVGRFDLHPGRYVLIPTTYDRHQEGSFLIRLAASKEIKIEELPESSNERRNSYGYGR